MANWIRRLLRRFHKGPLVVPDGKGYRIDDVWCASQKEVRYHLEEMGLSEGEIIRILRELNTQKHGDPQR